MKKFWLIPAALALSGAALPPAGERVAAPAERGAVSAAGGVIDEKADPAVFGRLPCLQGGRIKPLDTVARAALMRLRGRQSLRVEGKKIGAVRWLLDLIAAPEAADVYPVFRIEDPELLGLLGRRREDGADFAYWQLEPAFSELSMLASKADATEPSARTRFDGAVMNLADRVALYQRLRTSILSEPSSDARAEIAEFSRILPAGRAAVFGNGRSAKERAALAALAPYFPRWRFLDREAGLRPLPPVSGEEPERWTTLGGSLLVSLRSGEIDSAAVDLAELAGAWRARDGRAFNQAAARYAAEIGRRAPRAAARARWEEMLNRLQPFVWGMALYVAAFLGAGLSWLPGGRRVGAAPAWIYGAALLLHTAGLVWRMILEGRPPVTNLYSSAVFVGWTAAVLALVLELRQRKFFALAAGAAVGFSTLVIAHNLAAQGDTMEMMRAVLDSNFWLATHVVTITIGYGGAFLASLLAHMGLIRGRARGWRTDSDLKSLTDSAYAVTCFSLFFNFLGTVLGGIWADQSWGRFWGWDPKENGALLIVLWQAILLHARWGGFIRERGILVMTVGGGIVTALAWFGVNMLGVGLHSYGFMDGAFKALTAFIAFEAAACWYLSREGEVKEAI